jgi:hypothetical protein
MRKNQVALIMLAQNFNKFIIIYFNLFIKLKLFLYNYLPNHLSHIKNLNNLNFN